MKEKGKEKTPYTSWKGVGYALTELCLLYTSYSTHFLRA